MRNSDVPFCSVIVLNYFGEKVLEETVNSLLKLNYPREKYEIIIVDNNSKDTSIQLINDLSKRYNIIKPIFLKKNLGFSRGNNIGIRNAKGEYIALLNNDCVVDKNWLQELIKTAVKDKKTFAVNSKIYLQSSKKIQNAGIMIFQDGYGRDIGSIVEYSVQSYETDRGQYDKEREVYAACGAAVLYNRNILEEIGYLDESFFMYYEDVEISERARLHGYKTMYCPKATVYHRHALSSKEWSSFFIYQTEKGRLLHMFYHFPFVIFIKEYVIFIFIAIARFMTQLHQKRFFKKNVQYFKIVLFFILSFPTLCIRRIEKHQHIRKDAVQKEYKRLLSGNWYFN